MLKNVPFCWVATIPQLHWFYFCIYLWVTTFMYCWCLSRICILLVYPYSCVGQEHPQDSALFFWSQLIFSFLSDVIQTSLFLQGQEVETTRLMAINFFFFNTWEYTRFLICVWERQWWLVSKPCLNFIHYDTHSDKHSIFKR